MTTVTVGATIRTPITIEVVADGGSGLRGTGILVPVRAEALLGLIPAPSAPPLVPVSWMRVSETYPDPVPLIGDFDRPDPDLFTPTGAVTEILGRATVRVGGTDLTFWRDVPVQLVEWTDGEPWGWGTATVRWPHGTLLTSDTAIPMKKGQPFDVGLVNAAGVFVRWLWRGFAAEVVRDERSVTVTAVGLLRQTGYAQHQPPFWATVVDMGQAIADDLNGVVGRRFGPTTAVTTGIPTAKRGTRSDTVASYLNGLLGLATTDDGLHQWTVMPTDDGAPVIRWKDRTTQHWTVTVGGRGVDVRLTDDVLEDPNVIYGSGIDDNRERWDNSRWPGSNSNLAPPYPNSSPSNTIKQPETNANTDNGQGVTQVQARLTALGFTTPVSGSFTAATTKAVRAFQASAGIQVDGIVGGQTWNAMWPQKGVLGTPYFAPLAALPDVEPYVYAGDGAISGPNPDYVPSKFRVERYFAFGEGVSRVTAQAWSAGLIERNRLTPNVLGTINLTADPQEGSRRLVRAGQNIRAKGYGGTTAGVLLHIGGVIHSDERTTLTVDARARDALELSAIVARDRDAVDPARRILNARQSTADNDLSPWMSELPAGLVPRTALFSRLWSVMGIPMGPYGQVVRTLLTTQSPAAGFAVAVFSRQVSSSWLNSTIGDPLAEDSSGWGRMANSLPELEAAGYLIGWGQSGQAAGYEPGQTSPTGGTGTLTGKFQEDSSWEYACEDGASLWLAVYADRSTFISGRLYVVLPYGGGG